MNIEPDELKDILQAVISSQQPFYVTLTTQIAALESREIKRDETMHKIELSLNLLAQQNLAHEILLLDNRILVLESERQQRVGVAKAIELAPKMFGWAVLLVTVILAYLKLDITSVMHP